MNGLEIWLFYLAWLVLVLGVAVIVSRRRVKAMKVAAERAGIAGVSATVFGRVKGSWSGHPVTLRMMGGGRSGPERAVVEIAASCPGRLTIHKRMKLDITLPFGPPLQQTAFDRELLVRADDAMFAQRILGDTRIVEVLRATLVERLDGLDLRGNRVRATRTSRLIKREQAIAESWSLASTVVEVLGLPPAM